MGSKSVPRLAAKPTIDIAVCVPDLRLPGVQRKRWSGFDTTKAAISAYRETSFAKARIRLALPRPRRRARRLDVACLPYLRDHPRANPAAAHYEELKRSFLGERNEWYTGRDKESFIRPILDSSS